MRTPVETGEGQQRVRLLHAPGFRKPHNVRGGWRRSPPKSSSQPWLKPLISSQTLPNANASSVMNEGLT